MKQIVALSLLTFSLMAGASDHTISQEQQKALQKEAISIVKQFGGTLKPQLKQAMQSGGPVVAVKVCSQTAPEIATSLSQSSDWKVKRVSLKARNHSTAIPDDWETKVLAQFDQRNRDGESAEKMFYSEVVNGEYRFMKAQGVAPLCLNCHGTDIKPEITEALDKHYPFDAARGYHQGQIRGAFSLRKPLAN